MRKRTLGIVTTTVCLASALTVTGRVTAQTAEPEAAQSNPELDVTTANAMRETFGLPPLDRSQLSNADLKHSTIGLPLLPKELVQWDKYRDDVAAIRDLQGDLKRDPGNFGWLRIVSNKINSHALEIGLVNTKPNLTGIPSGWNVKEVAAQESEEEFNAVISNITTTGEARGGKRLRTAKEKIAQAVKSGAELASLSYDFTNDGKVLSAVFRKVPPGLISDADLRVSEGGGIENPDFTDRTSTVGQFKGGTYIDIPGVGHCTSNIMIKQGAASYALTAGHCFDTTRTGANPTWVANGTAVSHAGRTIGSFVQNSARRSTVPASGLNWLLDVAAINVVPNATATNQYMWRQPGGTNPTAENYYDNLHSWGDPISGELVCMEGASGYRNNAAGNWMQTVCGTQGSVDVSSASGWTQKRFVPYGGVWGSEVCEQDSGAIIRVPGGGSRVPDGLISGLFSGGTYDASANPNPAFGVVTRMNGSSILCTSQGRFTQIWLIFSAMGWSPQWDRGPSKVQNTRTGLCFEGQFEDPCQSATSLEFVPAGSVAEADQFMIFDRTSCFTATSGIILGVQVLAGGSPGCDYADDQKFQMVSAGGSNFRLRNVGTNKYTRALGSAGDGRVGLYPAAGDGDAYVLIGP